MRSIAFLCEATEQLGQVTRSTFAAKSGESGEARCSSYSYI
jgi:hypothetical protein